MRAMVAFCFAAVLTIPLAGQQTALDAPPLAPNVAMLAPPGVARVPIQLPAGAAPAALGSAQKAMAALAPSASVKDVTLTGSVTRTAGPDTESGTITLKALGNRLSRVEMNFGSGREIELRGADSRGVPKSSWTGADGTAHSMAGHNTLTDAVWFFPALTSLSRDPAKEANLSVSDFGVQQKNGASVESLHFGLHQPAPSALVKAPSGSAATPKAPLPGARTLDELSATEIDLDPGSSLPRSLSFNVHPDNNAQIDIPVEVRFSDYRPVNGVSVPFHIQKYLNGTLHLDITLQSAAINTGLQTTEFAAQ